MQLFQPDSESHVSTQSSTDSSVELSDQIGDINIDSNDSIDENNSQMGDEVDQDDKGSDL